MKDIALYINDKQVDIEDVDKFIEQFRLTLSFSDLENPAEIKDEYSYSVDLPGTGNNSEIFGRIDTMICSWVDVFNPSVPADYFVTVNGTIYRKGKCRLTNITINKGKKMFKVSFYGNLAAMFYDMKQTQLADSEVFDSISTLHTLNKETISDIWFGNSGISRILKYVPMQQGLYPDFDSKKIITNGPSHSQANPNGIYTIGLDDNMSEYMMSEYRSQYQRPALSVRHIISGLSSEYDFDLDPSFFNAFNPYYDNLFMAAGQYAIENSVTESDGTFMDATDTTPYDCSISLNTSQVSGEANIFNNTIYTGDNPYTLTVECMAQMRLNINWNDDFNIKVRALYNDNFTDNSGFTVRAVLTRAGETIYSDNLETLKGETFWRLLDYNQSIAHFYAINTEFQEWKNFPMRFTFHLPVSSANKTYTLRIQITNTTMHFHSRYNSNGTSWIGNSITYTITTHNVLSQRDKEVLTEKGFALLPLKYEINNICRTGSTVNVKNILSESITQADFLLGYTKMFGCIWDQDEHGKMVIKSRNSFFENYQVLDWTSKLDRSKDIDLEPLTFDKYKYVFGYDEGKSYLEEEYETHTGEIYGNKNIYPGYGFSSDDKELLDLTFKNTVMGKMNRKILENDSSFVTGQPYTLPCIYKENQGNNKGGYRLLFNCGYTELSPKEPVFITDDSSYMLNDDYGGKLCWISRNSQFFSGNRIMSLYIPHFDTRYDNCSLDFAKSKVSYAMESDATYPPDTCIYPRFWESYITELYDIHNRKMTAWFYLDQNDIRDFSFRNFVIIDNKLWHPVKLHSVSPLGDSLTKVELVEVHEIESYINGQIIPKAEPADFSNINSNRIDSYDLTEDSSGNIEVRITFESNGN